MSHENLQFRKFRGPRQLYQNANFASIGKTDNLENWLKYFSGKILELLTIDVDNVDNLCIIQAYKQRQKETNTMLIILKIAATLAVLKAFVELDS